ncbi:MAG: hypothetical protein GC147_09650 [Porphyrobacter sp.]|nr:hypothetical protein [Porphyrobacter sp.]
MPRLRGSLAALLAGALLALAGCGSGAAPAARTGEATPSAEKPPLGLMTSLPLYCPLGADLAALAAPDAAPPWQRKLLARGHALVPLDTLTPIPGPTPGAPETDPLAGLDRLAVIQPRGLSPADNVALDEWVRRGGRLLLVLDPALTGDYDLSLGDPRRPVDTALIPPVVERWGLSVAFPDPDSAPTTTALPGGGALPLALPGIVSIKAAVADRCRGGRALVTCAVGKGRVTLLADAAVFEHRELAGEGGAKLAALLAAAFD